MSMSLENLYRFPLFAGLDHPFLKELALMGEEITLSAGEVLFDEGDPADAIYVIVSGAVDLKMALNSDRIDLADLERLVEGETVGWSALIEPHVYTLRAEAASDVRLLKFNAPRLFFMLEQDKEAGFKMMYRLAHICRTRLANMHVRIVSLTKA